MESNQNQNQQSNFGDDLVEAEQEFAAQFDRTSKTFHGGDQTAVPVDGKRVPNSMPTEYDPEYMAKAQETANINYGEEYDKVTQLRTLFQDIKKVLNQVCPPLENILRIKLSEGEEAQKQTQIEAEKAKVKTVTDELQNRFISVLKQNPEYNDQFVPGLETICKDAFKDYQNKEDYMEFAFFVKKFTQKCFGETTTLLGKLKKIKADYKPSVQA